MSQTEMQKKIKIKKEERKTENRRSNPRPVEQLERCNIYITPKGEERENGTEEISKVITTEKFQI